MSQLNERIKEQRLKSGLTLLQVAKSLGVKEATAQRYESGEIKNIKHDVIASLANLFKCSPAYLMGWEENVFTDATNTETMPKTHRLPLLGNIACGEPILAVENIEDYVYAPLNIHADFCLRCKGDSMINARIFDGDIVYIRKQSLVNNGEIAAVILDQTETTATLKRFYSYPNKIVLQAENPLYEPLVYLNQEINNIRILGKAVAFTGTVK